MATVYRDAEDASFVYTLPSPAECASDEAYLKSVDEYEQAIRSRLWISYPRQMEVDEWLDGLGISEEDCHATATPIGVAEQRTLVREVKNAAKFAPTVEA